jgi:hypothetical protein
VEPVNGGDWAWIGLPATAFAGAAVKAITWLLKAERERGRAESYKEHAVETIKAKDAEIAALRAEVAALRATGGQGDG